MTDLDPLSTPTEVADAALDWINSTFARTVALILTPLLLPALGGGAVWLQNVVGIDMDPVTATGFVVAVVVGAAATAVTYVRNHGRGAAALAGSLLELDKLYEAGRGELARAVAGEYPALDAPEESGARPDSPGA